MASIKPRPENLAPLIFLVRGERVLLDADLAALYGVEVRALNQAVARNRDRFPDDFMFQLNIEEYEGMRSQFVTASGLLYYQLNNFFKPRRGDTIISCK